MSFVLTGKKGVSFVLHNNKTYLKASSWQYFSISLSKNNHVYNRIDV